MYPAYTAHFIVLFVIRRLPIELRLEDFKQFPPSSYHLLLESGHCFANFYAGGHHLASKNNHGSSSLLT